MLFRSEIHYIGGSEVLPAPLEMEEESAVIRVRIIDEYERTIVFVSGKRINIDDIYGILLSR